MYTRGQLEWAIAKAAGQESWHDAELSTSLRMKLKRLLDHDRQHGTNPVEGQPELARFAFFEGELPGKGVSISYSGADAFALLHGLRLLEANVPQSAVVRLLRRLRPELKHLYKQIQLRASTRPLTKNDLAKAQNGLLVDDVSDMIFLVLPSGAAAEHLVGKANRRSPANFAHSTSELIEVVAHLTRVSPPVLVFELVNPAIRISQWLSQAPHITRGRK